VVDVCNHKTRHDGFVLLPNCCELRRGPNLKFPARTEEVHDVADPKMRSAESQEVKRFASEYAKSKKLSEFGSHRCWFPYQLTSCKPGPLTRHRPDSQQSLSLLSGRDPHLEDHNFSLAQASGDTSTTTTRQSHYLYIPSFLPFVASLLRPLPRSTKI